MLSEERGTIAFAWILTHYFGKVAEAANMRWDWENVGEIEEAVERFAQAIEGVIAAEVERQVTELRGN